MLLLLLPRIFVVEEVALVETVLETTLTAEVVPALSSPPEFIFSSNPSKAFDSSFSDDSLSPSSSSSSSSSPPSTLLSTLSPTSVPTLLPSSGPSLLPSEVQTGYPHFSRKCICFILLCCIVLLCISTLIGTFIL